MKQLNFYFSLLILLAFTLFQISCSSSGTDNKKTITQNLVEPKEIEINFESMEEGDYPKNFGGLNVVTFRGNKVIGTPAKGNYAFEIKNPFPLDFRLGFKMAGNLGNKDYIAVTLMSPKGDLSFWIKFGPSGIVGSKWEFGFYDTQITGKINHSIGELSNVEIKKTGDVYKLYLANNFICSIQNNEFFQFTGVRVTINSPDKFEYEPYLKGCCISEISISRM